MYSNNLGVDINKLLEAILTLLAIQFLGGDFNCPSELWDPLHRGSSTKANNLFEASSFIGLMRVILVIGGYIFFPGDLNYLLSVLDLIFSPGGYGDISIRDKGLSNNAPILFLFAINGAP